ncbi:MAG TPA: DUF1272 domain-containing protein [Allosphingosinicella sp.]|nr:DUF1272 domain-containing protein [Allosphingosinicella sp.]
MLEMRPDCERCGRDLAPDSEEAFICSFECSFCAECTDGALGGRCPNCGGKLERRPCRATDLLERYPASSQRRGPR